MGSWFIIDTIVIIIVVVAVVVIIIVYIEYFSWYLKIKSCV
mgnify:CR=1 FL=1